MKKIFGNKQVVTIIALIACFAILFFAYRYRVDKAISAVSVPIATRTLKPRELIDSSCFDTRKKLAQSMLTKNVITSETELLGDKTRPAKYVNYNTFIPEGSMFYRTAVTTWDHMPDSAWADIEEGNTLFSLKVSNETTYGNSIFPGDKIDLYYTNRDTAGNVFIGPLVKGITVLAVKDANGNHIFKKSADQQEARALIFSVASKEFIFMKAADTLSGGEIVPVPRNANYNPEDKQSVMDQTGNYINNFIMSRIKISANDAL